MHLIVAHPGHELLLYGWISRVNPVVHVLTDGSGHSSASRLAGTAQFLDDAGARRGSIFGRFSDREAYAMIVDRNTPLLMSVVKDLASELENEKPSMIVGDAAEGYNPVHDLCRLIAGAAIAMAGVGTAQYEYAVVDHPYSPDAAVVFDLTDAEYDAKLDRARKQAGVLADVDDLLSRHGVGAYRREAFRYVTDWTAMAAEDPPRYERYGQDRVSAGRYEHAIRRDEHVIPLRDALLAAVEKHSCAF